MNYGNYFNPTIALIVEGIYHKKWSDMILKEIHNINHIAHHAGSENLPQLILGGGAAGGGKSYLGSCWLVSSCMRFPDIRAVVARKTLKSLKGSTWNTIKKVCKNGG